MTVRAVLEMKKREVKTIAPDARLEEAARLLHKEKIGAMPVLDANGVMVGILSERDIIHQVAGHGAEALKRQVAQVMTQAVVSVTIDEPLKDLMTTMTSRRIRHLPVLENGTLKGLVSIGDVIAHRLETTRTEVNVLRDVALSMA